jgi:hypothetical protein
MGYGAELEVYIQNSKILISSSRRIFINFSFSQKSTLIRKEGLSEFLFLISIR